MRQGVSLDDSVQELSEEVARRLIVLDQQLRVVGYSIHETDEDRSILSKVLAHSDSWRQPTIDRRGVGVVELRDVGTCLFIALRDHRYRVGFLLTVLKPPFGSGDDPLPAAELQILLDNAPALGVQLSLRGLYAERDRLRTASLLDGLVGPDPQRRAGSAEVLVSENFLGTARQYAAVALSGDPRATGSGESGRTALAVHLTLDFVRQASTASVVGATLDDATGIIVFPRKVVLPRLARILRRPEIRTVRAGVGPVVPRLTDVHRSFEFARRALRVTWLDPDRHAPVTEWDSCGLDGILARLPLESMGVDDLPASVRTLLRRDLGTELFDTLTTYLETGGDAPGTAQRLLIHRSTLYYRLDRLREVHGVDLSDGAIRAELQIGLRIAALARLRE